MSLTFRWNTPSGSLGTVPVGESISVQLSTSTVIPDTTVEYVIHSGNLPDGITMSLNGLVSGIPNSQQLVNGVFGFLEKEMDFSFVVRSYLFSSSNQLLQVTDRTFSITVTPLTTFAEFITPGGSIGVYLDATEIDISIDFTNPTGRFKSTVVSGQLPPGLNLSLDGKITGITFPVVELPSLAQPGFNDNPYAFYPYNFRTLAINQTFQFTVMLSDGIYSTTREFFFTVYSRNNIPPSTQEDTDLFQLVLNDPNDIVSTRAPFILNKEGSIGIYKHDNFFAYRFNVLDLEGDQTDVIVVDPTELPPGDGQNNRLTLSSDNGWLWGTLPFLGEVELEYEFTLYAQKRNSPQVRSRDYTFSLKILGEVENRWISNGDLGVLYSGDPSTKFIQAETDLGVDVFYSISSGVLPSGILLLPNGLLAGTPFFFSNQEDEQDYTFTVNAYSLDGQVNLFKEFSIKVIQRAAPWEKLLLKAMPPIADRNFYRQMLSDTSVFSPELIYRPLDKNFGVAKEVIYPHLYGLDTKSFEEYVDAVQRSHYRKKLVLGELKTAVAKDEFGQVIYEVVYSEIQDDIERISERVGLDPRIQNLPVVNTITQTGVFPNSLRNMQNRIIAEIGQNENYLPLWMRSVQSDGRIIGFIPAWVIAYVNPSEGKRVLYKLQEKYGEKINTIRFTIDRYILTEQTQTTGTTFDTNTTFFEGGTTTFDKVTTDGNFIIFPKRNILE